MSNASKRILYVVASVFCLVLFPWFVTVLLVVAGFFMWRHFVEGVIMLVLLDLIYGSSTLVVYEYPILFGLAGLVVFGIIELLKTRMRSHAF